ncbi:GMC family oxidoreductase [Aspergillus novofumigatus IBT 16806]|uniref:Alcohol oxidase n=1 Tax=Aspergillus novofumigatus (strain IBT 16806) TaxID=1392255 RepID=A0A2I1BV11_ASPN1|nr:alcohol oxidase [Aspergillus novofumigatus IBT 16806]PKX89194.1 alcohol oxidase [Aspergillus novofumigatus IBT 16806]
MPHISLRRKALVFCAVASGAVALRVPRYATVASRQSVSETKYDFIIAGGGISGLTVADRLTEDPTVNVLVIEAGPFDNDEDSVLVPGAYNSVPYLWNPLASVPQTALNNQSFDVPVGRVVGGGSVVNGMVFLRSGKQEYELWEELGATGWNWDAMLPYFKKSENFTAPDKDFARRGNISWVDDVHGNDGPVQISYPNFFFEGSAHWWDAALQTGLTTTEDPNGGNGVGVAWFPTSVDFTNRTRSHARLNHYTRVQDSRPNYHILAGHTISKVLLDGNKTVGVEYLPSAGGETLSASASKEVLVATGAVHTPQLLQLSGIGPKSLLDKFGIDVVADLPGVGANFQDQPRVIIPYNFSNNIQPNTDSLNSNATYDAKQRALYDSSREGAYVLTRGFSTNLATFPLCKATSECLKIVEAAREEEPVAYLPAGTDPTVLEGYKAQREITLRQLEGQDTPVAMIHWDSGNAVILFFLKPLSRGSVSINSTNPLASPLIDFRAMADPIDLDLVIASFLKNREIMNAPSMKTLGPSEGAPFDDSVTDREELKNIVVSVAEPSTAHECCTAAMMPKEKGGVVDPNMKVYGVEGLRVIDISYWPMILSAPPMATMYASGEKIADEIKKEHCLDGACD